MARSAAYWAKRLVMAGLAALTALAASAPARASRGDVEALASFAAQIAAGDADAAAATARGLLDADFDELGLSVRERLEARAAMARALAEIDARAAAVEVLMSVINDADADAAYGPLELMSLNVWLAELALADDRVYVAARAMDRALILISRLEGGEFAATGRAERVRARLDDELRGALAGESNRDLGAVVRQALEMVRAASTAPGGEPRNDAFVENDIDGFDGELGESDAGPGYGGPGDFATGDRGEMADMLPPPAPVAEAAPAPAAPGWTRMSDDDPGYVVVPVYYGTNREPTGSDDPDRYYGSRRGSLDVGVVSVSVPTQGRAVGAIPRANIFRGEFRPNPSRHVILQDIERFGDLNALIAQMRAQMAASQRREAIVFIHGYNTEFRGAAERTAQLYVDLEIDGAAVLYSWPSRGGVLGYVADGGQLVRPVLRDLQVFLQAIAERSGAERVHLIAHSMGNRYLLEALEEFADNDPAFTRSQPFDEVVFAAPDIDAADFAARAPEVAPIARRMTMYASASDRALALSRLIHGDYRRAGDASAPLVIEGVVDTIDTTPVGGEALGHDDFVGPAIADFRSLILFSLEPSQRCVLARRAVAEGAYWAIEAEADGVCDRNLFNAAIDLLRDIERATGARDGLRERALAAIDAMIADPSGGPENVDWRGVREIVADLPPL